MKKKYLKPQIKIRKKSFVALFSTNRSLDSYNQLLEGDGQLLSASGLCTEKTTLCCGFSSCI